MLTYSKFGNNGRLGNQMFQFATLYSFAKLNNLKYFLPKIQTQNVYQTINEFESFALNEEIKNSFLLIEDYQQWYNKAKILQYVEPSFSYKEICIDVTKNIDFCGYFQSEKYFKNFKRDLIDLYKPLNKSQKCLNFENYIIENKVISVHVRRGDYVNKSNFHTNLVDTNYYQDALKYFDGENYLFFSDDLEFCKKHFNQLNNAKFAEGLNTTEELYLQTICSKNIIANSSFSWWGAWLKEKETGEIIAPKRWFGREGPKDTFDLYPQNWIII